jgi:hypothetical protein
MYTIKIKVRILLAREEVQVMFCLRRSACGTRRKRESRFFNF